MKHVDKDEDFGEYFNNLYGSSSDANPFWYQSNDPLNDKNDIDQDNWSHEYSRSEDNNVEQKVLPPIEPSSNHNNGFMGFNEQDPFQNIAEG